MAKAETQEKKTGRPVGPLTKEQQAAKEEKRKHVGIMRQFGQGQIDREALQTNDTIYNNLIAAAAYLHPLPKASGRSADNVAERFFNFIKEAGGEVTFMQLFDDFGQGNFGGKAFDELAQENIKDQRAWISYREGKDNKVTSRVYVLHSEGAAPEGWTGYVYKPRVKKS